MENRSYALWVGMITLLLLAALIGWAIWFDQGHVQDQSIYQVVTRSSVSGLNRQALVRYRGVEVGHVQSIRFAPDGRTILIRIGIRPDTLITSTTYARLEYQGLTGLAYIELNDKGKKHVQVKTSLSHPAQIVMLPSLLQQVGDTGQALLVDLEQIADQMNRLLDRQNIRHWSQTLQNLSRATRQLNELEASIAPVVSRLPQTSQQMEQTLRDTDETVRQLGRLSKELGPKLRVLDEVGKAGSQVTQVAQTVHDTTLPEIQALIIRLNHSAIRLDDALRQQQQYPQELLWGRPPVPPGPGEPGFQVKEKE